MSPPGTQAGRCNLQGQQGNRGCCCWAMDAEKSFVNRCRRTSACGRLFIGTQFLLTETPHFFIDCVTPPPPPPHPHPHPHPHNKRAPMNTHPVSHSKTEACARGEAKCRVPAPEVMMPAGGAVPKGGPRHSGITRGLPTSRNPSAPSLPMQGLSTNPPIHKWRIPSSKGEHVRTLGSTIRHAHSAFTAPPPTHNLFLTCVRRHCHAPIFF